MYSLLTFIDVVHMDKFWCTEDSVVGLCATYSLVCFCKFCNGLRIL